MGLESFTPVGIGIDAATQLFKMLFGAGQVIGGNKNLKNLDRPTATVDPNILYNQQLGRQNASQGFGDQYLNFGSDAINRNFGTTVNSFEKTGQGLNSITGAQGQSNNAFQQLLMADAMQKQRNQQTLFTANKDLAEENLRVQNWNEIIPYEQAFTKYTNQTNSGWQNLFGGGQGLGSSAVAFGDYFSNGSGSGNKSGSSGGSGGSGGDSSAWFNQMMDNYLKNNQLNF